MQVPQRLAFIDALKAVASQLIVLHHLAFYGPMSDVANDLAPQLIAWLSQHARIAVQMFLVMGGFLAAKSIAPDGILITKAPFSLLKKRYFKLVIPYAGALLLGTLCAAIARNLMDHDSIPTSPTIWQVLGHLTLLHSLLEFDSLSAGVWYVAIDFQLFALLLLLLWIPRLWVRQNARPEFPFGIAMVAGLAAASLFVFNLDENWDSYGIYFFGAYGLGALTYWATSRKTHLDWLVIITAVAVAALIYDFRSRIAVALATAIALGLSQRWGFLETQPHGRLFAYLGKISYSVFLAHFPILLVINGLFAFFAPSDPSANAFGIVFGWFASIAAGAIFYRFIESQSSTWLATASALSSRLIGRCFPTRKERNQASHSATSRAK
ncbi:acyltransferase family protein [Propionivibrio limicola]|uniref:acyltransferase family protein n=1 Tax=Propionivibrio limicola TaxID=167645 RepID=UPI00129271C6|nr:acyltransferase [Propionivibrio limicola]